MPNTVTILGTTCLEITPDPIAENASELIPRDHICGVFPLKFQQKPSGDEGLNWDYPFPSVTVVRFAIVDGRNYDLELQNVSNQYTWNNGTQTGLHNAMDDINAWLNGGTIITPPPANAFTIVVNTALAGVSANNQFKLPLKSGGVYNATINWGDTTSTTQLTDVSPTHTYPAPGTYIITITGTFPSINFNNTDDKLKLIDISAWGSIAWTGDLQTAFNGCSNLTGSYTDSPDLSSITSLAYMFAGCSSFNGIVDLWDTSAIDNMSGVFQGCTSFNQPINSWDTSLVTGMTNMFFGCTLFNQSVSSWDVSLVDDFGNMFRNCTAFNQPLSTWDVSSATSLQDFMTGKTAANYSAAYLDGIYNAWSLLTLNVVSDADFGTIKYTAGGSAGRLVLTSAPNLWGITDGGI